MQLYNKFGSWQTGEAGSRPLPHCPQLRFVQRLRPLKAVLSSWRHTWPVRV